jgi:hypothetical protein
MDVGTNYTTMRYPINAFKVTQRYDATEHIYLAVEELDGLRYYHIFYAPDNDIAEHEAATVDGIMQSEMIDLDACKYFNDIHFEEVDKCTYDYEVHGILYPPHTIITKKIL